MPGDISSNTASTTSKTTIHRFTIRPFERQMIPRMLAACRKTATGGGSALEFQRFCYYHNALGEPCPRGPANQLPANARK